MKKPVIIGVGGPVGSGKTLLIERITRLAKDEYNNEQLKDTELTFTVPYNKIPVKVNNVSVNNNTVSIYVDKPYELLKYIDTNYHKFQIPEDQGNQEFSITIGDYNWKEDYGWNNPKFDTRENTKSVSFPSDILTRGGR